MNYFDTGVVKFAVGVPNESERKDLEEQGYHFHSKGKMAYKPHEPYEIWVK